MSLHQNKKIGILGGGQLGRMLLQQGINYNIQSYVLDPDVESPCKNICLSFTPGSLLYFDTVYKFGKELDIITIEIEHVNVEALEKLEKEGKTIIPKPAALKIIQDKGLQKQFYKDNNIPTADFILVNKKKEITTNKNYLPVFQKLRRMGYDGKGVIFLKDEKSLENAFDEPSVLEKLCDFDKEIAVIVAVGQDGEIKAFPPVELIFNPKYNLVDYLVSPADLKEKEVKNATDTAIKVAKALQSPGIFAVEMFQTKEGDFLVNETAPRAHNSGHQSIEGNFTSQFEQQWRILLNLPLGDTSIIHPSLMLNIIGEPGHSGPAVYNGLEQILAIPGVYLHLYGKKETRPGRKMGHVTITGNSRVELMEKAALVKKQFKVTT